jgi:hypothetical protein
VTEAVTVCILRARSRLDYAWDNPRGTRRLRLRGCFRALPAAAADGAAARAPAAVSVATNQAAPAAAPASRVPAASK